MSEDEYDENEPIYECDYEYPCLCLESGLEGEWIWCSDNNYWQCTGCNETQ